MDKKFVVLLIVLALIFLEVYFKLFSTIITGLVSIVMSIAQEMRICLEYMEMPKSVVQLSTVSIKVGLFNCGSVGLNESTLVFETRDRNNNAVYTTENSVLNLSIDERREVTTYWYAGLQPGGYTMHVRAVYDNESSNEIASNFTVTPAPYVPPTLPPGPGAPKIVNISVSYPPKLNMTQDAVYIVLIKVENTGEVDIHNLILKLESQDIETEVIYPDILPVLDIGSSVIFTTELTVPPDLEPGTYTIDWFVISDEVNKTGTIIGEVRVLDIREKAEELLAYYTAIVERLEEEIDAAEEEGWNVTLARNALEDAKTELEIAKELFRIGLYSGCIEQLSLVREKIIEAARLLVLAKRVPKVVVIPALPTIPCLFWVIIVIIINSVIVLFTVKKLHWVKIVLIMLVVSIVMGLLAGLGCFMWIIVTTLIMILVFILIVFRERLKRRPEYLLRFRRW